MVYKAKFTKHPSKKPYATRCCVRLYDVGGKGLEYTPDFSENNGVSENCGAKNRALSGDSLQNDASGVQVSPDVETILSALASLPVESRRAILDAMTQGVPDLGNLGSRGDAGRGCEGVSGDCGTR
jgi:hypothetical protein